MTLTVQWKGDDISPKREANPDCLTGYDIIMTFPHLVKTCTIDLPYPALGGGTYIVACDKCLRAFAVPATGYADDPKSITISCWLGWDSAARAGYGVDGNA